MTQHVLDYSQNPSGVELMDDYLAGMAENQLTNHSGLTRPSYAKAGTFWIDTSVTPWVLKQFNGTNDVTVGTLDQTNLYFTAQRALNDKNGNDIANSLATLTTADGQNVKVTGDQNVGGKKTLTDVLTGQAGVRSESVSSSDTRDSFFIAKNKRFSLGTAPSTNITTQVNFQGNDGEWAGLVEHNYRINGNTDIALTIRRPDKLSSYGLGIGCTPSGGVYTFAPTPSSATDNSTKIATTAHVNNFANATRTNCITEIPQDINLELNNGTLTLKAGSKIYVPNGAGVFDTRVFTQDVSITSLGSVTGKFLLTYGQSVWNSRETFDYFNVSQGNLFSGPSQPTTTSTNSMWYDTTNNVIKTTSNAGSTWVVTNNTFPICIVTVSSGTITSIDQVFNGFGYIGSTIFALPGLTAVIPNGRYSNGMPMNNVVNVSSVLTSNVATTTGIGSYKIFLYGSGIGTYTTFIYDQTTNKNYISKNISSEYARGAMLVGSVYMDSSNGKIVRIDTADTFNGASRFDARNITSNYLSNIAQGNYKEKTILFQGPITGGNITLSRPYTDFDALMVLGCADGNGYWWTETNLITQDELNTRIERSRGTTGVECWVLFNLAGNQSWTCRSDSTTTSFLEYQQNCQIVAIYGINF